jgi:hypothetical protein
MSFINKVKLKYALQKIVTAGDIKVKYIADVGLFPHEGKNIADWKSFKKVEGILSDAVVGHIQKIEDSLFSVFNRQKIDVDPKSCHISVDGNVLDFIYLPKDKTKDIYAEITFIFNSGDGAELDVKNILSKKDIKELELKAKSK